MRECRFARLRGLLLVTKDGDWGHANAGGTRLACRVIRGGDFPAARKGDIFSIPTRFVERASLARRCLQPLDILIETAGGTRDRPTGRTLLVTENLLTRLKEPVVCASFARFMRPDPATVEPSYLFWFLQYLYAEGEMWQYQVEHTGVARFQFTRFAESLQVPLPELEEQRAIAEILGALDEKIELNRETNRTLEETAQALFRSWFVYFDPVVAKADERNPFGMSEEFAALFPSNFEDSEVGLIPKGWNAKKLDECLELRYGKALPERARGKGSVPVFGSDGQVGCHDVALVSGPGIILGRKGNAGRVTWSETPFFAIDTTFYVVPKQMPLGFLYFSLKNARLENLVGDSAVPGLSRNAVYQTAVVAPIVKLAVMFDDAVRPLQRLAQANAGESQTLAELRDLLLHKLLSGEIRVGQAERAVEAAL